MLPIRIAHGVYWPVYASLTSVILAATRSSSVVEAGGPSRLRQWRDMFGLAHRWNYHPATYYTYRLFDPARRAQATEYLQVDELVALQVDSVPDTELLDDKRRFHERCAELGLATPPLIAVVTSTRWDGDELPARDLFVKPLRGQQGIDAEFWQREHDSDAWHRHGEVVDRPGLVERIRQRASPSLVQAALVNHSELARLSPRLSTFRVVTYRDPDDRVSTLGVTLKVAPESADVDNFSAGALACEVDPATGHVADGVLADPMQPRQPLHPDTGAVVGGSILSCHREVVDLAERAHRVLDVPPTVGWDVAATPTGAVLIEGNPMWSIDALQVIQQRPVAASVIDALLEAVERGA